MHVGLQHRCELFYRCSVVCVSVCVCLSVEHNREPIEVPFGGAWIRAALRNHVMGDRIPFRQGAIWRSPSPLVTIFSTLFGRWQHAAIRPFAVSNLADAIREREREKDTIRDAILTCNQKLT